MNSTMIVRTICPVCGDASEVPVPTEGYRAYQAGALIQDALPGLSPGQREALLTGTCDPCWERLFPPDADDALEPDLPDPTQPRKPAVQLVGYNGNVFVIIGRVRDALRRDGQPERAEEWVQAAKACRSYDEVLQLTFSYVEPS